MSGIFFFFLSLLYVPQFAEGEDPFAAGTLKNLDVTQPPAPHDEGVTYKKKRL